MIYPANFEQKIGFNEIRDILKGLCHSTLGKSVVDEMTFLTKASDINELLEQIREYKVIITSGLETGDGFYDCREALKKIKVQNTWLDAQELYDLRRGLASSASIAALLNHSDADDSHALEEARDGWARPVTYTYPALHALAEAVMPFPSLVARMDQIIDKYGNIRDTASPRLAEIRAELKRTEGSISRTLNGILQSAKNEGTVEKDVTPTMRDGRLVIPVAPGLKRKIKGIVLDESATGKTVFVEPAVVVEANNRIRELQSDERQEIISILTAFTDTLRPHVHALLLNFRFLAHIDFIQAKARYAVSTRAEEPHLGDMPLIDWRQARHPLLEKKLAGGGDRKIVPLDITLTPEKHILIISGPNAGGKSVCLKTVGLLQYMLQCGMSIPVGDRSEAGVFADIMIDMGDEQSLENDLSTYSSHLLNMKNMLKQATGKTLLLIDEFGTGTEPQIGGAIAESVLSRLTAQGAWGVITTHYQNLKHFADSHDGVVNGAMLYDRAEMRPLFQLAIGRPGSSFAIDIARKIGLPADVINEASDIVGSDYIQSDKYLQDIVRDKRYWENKRQNIHQREKDLEKTISQYEERLEQVEKQRKEIIEQTRRQQEELFKESNRRIENTIREIRQSQAEKEQTRKLRQELKEFEQTAVADGTKQDDDAIARKIEQIKSRRERHEKHMRNKKAEQTAAAEKLRSAAVRKASSDKPIAAGDSVRIKGTTTIGRVESVDGKTATVVFGDVRTKTSLSRLEHSASVPAAEQQAAMTKADRRAEELRSADVSRVTQQTIDSHRHDFHQDIDVRGMRGDEALMAVQRFIDDAILTGVPRVRILHGKGNGILRQLIRQYLSTVPNVTHFADEHVQFGGAGITVVDL